MRGAVISTLVALAALAGPARSAPDRDADAVVVETGHYRLEAEYPRAQAEEFGRVLEAAWPQFEEFFGAAPKLEEGERLRVFVGATKASFEARMREDGVRPPRAGGYYSPGNRTAYLYRQPTIYYTRVLLLHETTHQFHYLARTRNRHIDLPWYVEGLAEHLGRHHWDGKRLAIGQLPVLSQEDYAARAEAKLEEVDGDLAAAIEEGYGARPVYWALVRYLLEADGGRHAKKFRSLMAKLDRGAVGESLLYRSFGSPKKLGQKLLAWVAGEQEPWKPIFNEWEGRAEDRIRGTAPGAIVSACRAKADLARLEAVLEVPESGNWIGGLLLHYTGGGDYSTAMVYGGREVRVVRRKDDRWNRIATMPLPELADPRRIRFEARREAGRVHLLVEGKELGVFELPGAKLGLALQGSTLEFRDVVWEPLR